MQRRLSDERMQNTARRPVSGRAQGAKIRPPNNQLNRPKTAVIAAGARPARGGLAGARRALAAPKRHQKTLRINVKSERPQSSTSSKPMKSFKPSEVRLKVRNFDEEKVTNDDLKKLFAKIGELKVCRFDTNEFGQFLGSATVTYERPEDAKQAIIEYNGAFLDEKVLVVEYDMVPLSQKAAMAAASGSGHKPTNNSAQKNLGAGMNKGKTLRLKN